MRRQIILPSLVLLCTACLCAAPRQALMPGFGRQLTEKQKVERVKSPKTNVKRQAPAKNLVSSPKRLVVGRSEAETKKVDRLISYDVKIGNFDGTVKREYDQYGFPAKDTASNGNIAEYSYIWLVPGSVWSAKSVKTYSNGEFSYEESDKRTFHPNGMVATRETQDLTGSKMYYEYDANGYMVLEKDVDNNNTSHWTLLPGIGRWIETWDSDYSRQIITLDGDFGYTVEYQISESEEWKTQSIEGRWFNDQGDEIGNMYVYYDYDQDFLWGVREAYGGRIVKVDNGSTYEVVTENFEFDSGSSSYTWVPEHKTVYSSNYETPWVYSEGQIRTRDSFNYTDGKWGQTYSETYSWVNSQVVKDEEIDYEYDNEKTVQYYMPDQTSGELGDDIYYDASTGNYAVQTCEDYYYYYTYYDAKGNVVSRYREYDGPSSNISEWAVWNGNDWVACEGTHTIYEDSDDHYVITFDAQGRPAVVDGYEDGALDCRDEYEYTADGYICKFYVARNDGSLRLETISEFSTDASGVKTEKRTEYDSDGTISYSGDKYDPSTGVHYSLQFENGQWIETPSWVDDIFEILADGTQVRISRQIDADGNVVDSYKEVSLTTPTHEMNESYSWNTDLNMWVGNWKSERAIVDDGSFVIIAPSNPEVFYDEYFTPAGEDNEAEDNPWSEAQYQWDYENNTGWVCFRSLPEVTYPDNFTKVLVCKSLEDSMVETWTVDEARRQTYYSIENYIPDNQLISSSYNTCEYDEKGRLAKHNGNDYDGQVWSYIYHYGTIEVVGVEDVIASEQGNALNVYNLQGICVLRNAEPAALRTLQHGIYIVNGRKTAIR